MFGFAMYMRFLARRSAAGTMGSNGPGIRMAETTRCEHTWAAAQEVAAPIYRKIATALAATAAVTIALSAINPVLAFAVAVIAGFGVEVFFLGVASVRARKAVAAIDCEHSRAVKSQSPKSRGKKSANTTPPSAFSPAHRRRKKRR